MRSASGNAPTSRSESASAAAVAVLAADRIGEPAQLAARSAARALPRPVAPVERPAAEGAVVLAGAGGAGRARLGHVDFGDAVELAGGVTGQYAGEPGCEAGADHDRQGPLGGFGVEVLEKTNGLDVIAGRHDVGAGGECGFGHGSVSVGTGEHNHVGLGAEFRRPGRNHGRRSERLDDLGRSTRVGVDDTETLDAVGRGELSRGAGARCTNADDDGAHQRRSGPESSRQPPSFGGLPPVPRSRSTPATIPAMPRASRARRSAFIGVGLAGIEPATSALSVLRSNRLSYSPGRRSEVTPPTGGPLPPTR